MTTDPIVPGDLFARHQTITGLRALADFLEANPSVPVREYGEEYILYAPRTTDDCARALVDQVAALLGSTVTDDTDQGGHYETSRRFGRITYRVIHIPTRAREEHTARMSYLDNITLTPDRQDRRDGAAAGHAA